MKINPITHRLAIHQDGLDDRIVLTTVDGYRLSYQDTVRVLANMICVASGTNEGDVREKMLEVKESSPRGEFFVSRVAFWITKQPGLLVSRGRFMASLHDLYNAPKEGIDFSEPLYNDGNWVVPEDVGMSDDVLPEEPPEFED